MTAAEGGSLAMAGSAEAARGLLSRMPIRISAEKTGTTISEDTDGYVFTVAKVEGQWYIVHSNFFEKMTPVTPAKVISWIFFGIAVCVVVRFFWGWMLLDCSLRYRNWAYSIAVLLTPPLGALYYFFAVWLRRPTGEIGE